MIIKLVFSFFLNIILFKIYLCSYLSQYFETHSPFMFKCLEDSIKIEDICAIEGSATTEDEETLLQITTNYLYIKEECDTDERCKRMGDSTLFQCFPKIKKLEIGEKCIVNEECYTGFCSMDICQGLDFEAECTDYPNACKPGLYCTKKDKDNNDDETKICAEYSYLHEKCGEIDGLTYIKKCFPGLGCHLRENNSGDKICKKWGTVLLNREIESEEEEILCETGISMEDTDYDGKIKCISVEEDGECDQETHKCSPQIVGLGATPDIIEEMTMDCIQGINGVYTCPVGVGRSNIFRKYIDKYNELYDSEKLRKSQYFKEGYFNEQSLSELYIIYKEYQYLKAYDIIDYEGNPNGIYSCEYDFIWTFISSGFIKPNFIIVTIMILIFVLR